MRVPLDWSHYSSAHFARSPMPKAPGAEGRAVVLVRQQGLARAARLLGQCLLLDR